MHIIYHLDSRNFYIDYFDGKGDGVATPKFSPEGYLELMARMEIEWLSISYQCGAR